MPPKPTKADKGKGKAQDPPEGKLKPINPRKHALDASSLLPFQTNILRQLVPPENAAPSTGDALLIMARGLGLRTIVTTFVRSLLLLGPGGAALELTHALPLAAQDLRHARQARARRQCDARGGAELRRGGRHAPQDDRVRGVGREAVRPRSLAPLRTWGPKLTLDRALLQRAHVQGRRPVLGHVAHPHGRHAQEEHPDGPHHGHGRPARRGVRPAAHSTLSLVPSSLALSLAGSRRRRPRPSSSASTARRTRCAPLPALALLSRSLAHANSLRRSASSRRSRIAPRRSRSASRRCRRRSSSSSCARSSSFLGASPPPHVLVSHDPSSPASRRVAQLPRRRRPRPQEAAGRRRRDLPAAHGHHARHPDGHPRVHGAHPVRDQAQQPLRASSLSPFPSTSPAPADPTPARSRARSSTSRT